MILELNRLLPELSALCLETAGSANLLAELLTDAPGFLPPAQPCAAVCRKNGALCGRRGADDSAPMTAAEGGFGNALYRLGAEA